MSSSIQAILAKMKAEGSRIAIFLALANNQVQDTQSFLLNQNQRQMTSNRAPIIAFAGFGSSASTKKKGKKNKKKKRGLKSDDLRPEPSLSKPSSSSNSNDEKEPEVQLDRFGFPIRTAENFFPDLPPDIEILGYEYGDGATHSKLNDIRKAMEKHIPLNYNIFDESAVEKKIGTEEEDDDGDSEDPLNIQQPWKLKLLHKSPPVLEIQNFFTPLECHEYRSISDEEFQPTSAGSGSNSESGWESESPLRVNSATFSTLAQSKRTSTTWFCHFSQVPTLLAKAKRLLNNLPLKQMEEAQIVRYRTGEEFSWHYDEIPKAQLENGGQRIATLLVYLNTNSKGGGTVFRDLKDSTTGEELTMRPKEGSALLFFPAFADGTPDDRTLHKGEVAVENKMIAQMWIHEREYTPVVPNGNTHEAAIEAIRAKEKDLGYN